IQLADTACHAGFGTFDPTPSSNPADDNTPCSTNVHILQLSPDTSTAGLKATHTLLIQGQEPIGGPADGNTYYLDVINGTDFQVKNSAGSVITPSAAPGGTHRFSSEGVAVTVASSGTERLVVNLTSNGTCCSDPNAPHVLIGVGGPHAVLGKS